MKVVLPPYVQSPAIDQTELCEVAQGVGRWKVVAAVFRTWRLERLEQKLIRSPPRAGVMPEWNCQTTVTNKVLHIQTRSWCFCEYVVTFMWYKIEKDQKCLY